MNTKFKVTRATLDDLPLLTRMFDEYRVFYGQPSDQDLAARFLSDRMRNGESIVMLSRSHALDEAVGFVQLYPSFSSIGAARILIVNDLYVVPAFRRHGAGRQLLDSARCIGAEIGALKLVLSTAHSNVWAQALYLSLGYIEDQTFRNYYLPITKSATIKT